MEAKIHTKSSQNNN